MRVLVVAAHPDDEVLGVGGTILRHVEAGDLVVIYLACCGELRDGEDRIAASRRVADALGATLVHAHHPQLGATAREVTGSTEEVVAAVRPDIVYTHHHADLNSDHRALNEAVLVACRPYASSVRSIRLFETPSSTEWGVGAFAPNLFVGIDALRRGRILAEYESELREEPHPRSRARLLSRARHWGSISGQRYAEAFQVVRETW